MSLPPTVTRPEAAGVNPVSASMREVFPAPFGPMRPTTWPGSIEKPTLLTAVTVPYCTVRSSISKRFAGTFSPERSSTRSDTSSNLMKYDSPNFFVRLKIRKLRAHSAATPSGLYSTTNKIAIPLIN